MKDYLKNIQFDDSLSNTTENNASATHVWLKHQCCDSLVLQAESCLLKMSVQDYKWTMYYA